MATQLVTLGLLLLGIVFRQSFWLYPLPVIWAVNLFVNIRLIKAFYAANGFIFTCLALLYYTLIYSLAVAAGAFAGILRHFFPGPARFR